MTENNNDLEFVTPMATDMKNDPVIAGVYEHVSENEERIQALETKISGLVERIAFLERKLFLCEDCKQGYCQLAECPFCTA